MRNASWTLVAMLAVSPSLALARNNHASGMEPAHKPLSCAEWAKCIELPLDRQPPLYFGSPNAKKEISL